MTAPTAERSYRLDLLLRRTKHNLASLAKDAGVERAHLHRYENLGMTAMEAAELCEAIGADPRMVWDDWSGAAPVANGKARAVDPPPLIWEDPPPARGRGLIDPAALAVLRANPGRWARVKEFKYATGAATAAGKIRKGDLGERFEARGVRSPAGSTLYVRWVGEG